MKTIFKYCSIIIFILFSFSCSKTDSFSDSPLPNIKDHWTILDKGLELGRFNGFVQSDLAETKIHILRIDPNVYQFRLLNASAMKNGKKQTAKKWCQKFRLIAAINASMYQKDHLTSVSLMRSEKHTNNAYISKDKTIFAFEPKIKSDPPVKIIDRECDDVDIWLKKYKNLIQSIRMISCKRKNVWAQQPEKWSIAAIGMDHEHRVLFIHTRFPYTSHDFINILMDLPIQITQAMYVEGGPEAQLYIQTSAHSYEFIGDYESEYKGKNHIARPIPNIIGITLIFSN